MVAFLARYRAAGLLASIAVLALAVGAVSPHFLAVSTAAIILTNALVLIVVAAGVTGVILTRNIDVSVGSILALSAAVLGLLLKNHWGLPLAAAASLATGLACGLLNGVLVALVGMPSIIATLGTLGVFRGAMLLLTGSVWIEDLPESVKHLARPVVAGLSPAAIATVALVAALGLFLARTTPGRHVYAVGDNAQAAGQIGLPVTAIRLLAFAASGLFAAIGGIVFSAQIGFIPSNAGNGLELRAIAACVLGGVSLLGGVGRIEGVIAAVVFLSAIDTALIFLKIPGYWNDFVAGLMLLGALLLDGRLRAAVDRSIRRRRYRGRVAAPGRTEAA